jgi:hypothetical protein
MLLQLHASFFGRLVTAILISQSNYVTGSCVPLHVLPPHLLAYAVGASSETLGGHGEVVGFVLQGVQTGGLAYNSRVL